MMSKARKGLGRGLSALIPEADMEFLSRVARGADMKKPTPAHKIKTPSGKHSKAVMSKGDLEINEEISPTTPERAQRDHAVGDQSPIQKAGTNGNGNQATPRAVIEPATAVAELVPVSAIEANPYQPRRTFSSAEMQELSDSIKEHGILQPVLLRPIASSSSSDQTPNETENRESSASGVLRYQLVAGERRWRAAQMAGIASIPAIVRIVSNQQSLELAVIENVQRHDISVLDAAIAYRKLVQEFSLSQEDVARRVGKSRAAVANTMRLLDLPTEVKKAIDEGELSEGHGRAILLAAGDGARRAVFRRVLREKLSVRAAEDLARGIQTSDDIEGTGDSANGKLEGDVKTNSGAIARQSPEISRIEAGLQKHLGTRVRLRTRRQGGQLTIQFFSNDELERLVKMLMR